MGVDRAKLPDFHQVREEVDPCGQLVITAPSYFIRGRADTVWLRLEGLDSTYRPRRLLALCSSKTPRVRPFSAAAIMNRAVTNGCYEGVFKFMLAEPKISLPTLYFSLIADGQQVGSLLLSGAPGGTYDP